MPNYFPRMATWCAALLLAGLSSMTTSAATPTHLHDEYVAANGIRFHCMTRGRGELLLFLHGFPESSDSEFGHETAREVVRVPALVIWGEQDPALPAKNLEGLQQFAPQLTLKRIPDGSHWVVHEKPAEVNRYIRDFIG
jgi:pimeloyl-ACP methyl ester carboxylesterase